jgi:hypothetical protein
MSGWRRAQASRGGVVLAAAAVALVTLLNGAVASASTRGVPRAMVGCWNRHAPALPVGTSAGVWLMKITRGDELLAFTPGTKSCSAQPDFTGTISVAGSRLTIGQLPVCPTKGAYTWKAATRALTLKATRDNCPSRKLLFTGKWKKV